MKPAPGVRLWLAFHILILVSACAAPVQVQPTLPGVTMTIDPASTSTPTPFLPVVGTPLPTQVPSQTPTSSPSPTATSTFTPMPATRESNPEAERSGYVFLVDLDYGSHHLVVDETIQYPNHTGVVLDSLVLAVEPNRWVGVFQLNQLRVDGQEVNDYTLQDGQLTVSLVNPLAVGDSLNLGINYELYLPWNGTERIFGYNNWQINIVDWYPFVVPYDPDTGWLLHEASNVGEHLVMDSVDFDVTIRQSADTENLMIAASAPAEPVENGTRYTLNGARTFVFSASTTYQTSSAMVGDITVTSYYADGSRLAGEAILNATTQALEVYSQIFAPYPYKSLSIVETTYTDGMEYDGLFFLSRDFYLSYDGTLLNNLVMIGIHEAAHQWWFGLVGNDQALEPWLDEALSTYSERIFYEQVNPSLVGLWWNYRVDAFNPAGMIDITIYQGGAFRPYTNAVYLRSARFLENLRIRMGEEAFLAFLKDYAAQMSYKRSTADDFFTILSSHLSVDISDIITNYFQNSHQVKYE
jgi:hypothetical protein